jgi:hypothetical protein
MVHTTQGLTTTEKSTKTLDDVLANRSLRAGLLSGARSRFADAELSSVVVAAAKEPNAIGHDRIFAELDNSDSDDVLDYQLDEDLLKKLT